MFIAFRSLELKIYNIIISIIENMVDFIYSVLLTDP